VRRSLLVLSVLALVLGACGSSGPDPQEDPQAALTSAFESLTEAEGVTMTMSVRSDAGSLRAMSEGTLSEADAQKILDSSLTVTGRNETDPKKAQSEISADIAGIDDAVEIKVIGTTMYVRGAVRDIMQAFGADPSAADRFVADGNTAGITWAEPAVEGEWLEIAGLDELGKQFGAADMDQTAAQQREILNKLSNLIERTAKAEPGDKEGPGDHLIVKLNVRDLYDGFLEIAGSLGTMAGAGLPQASEVPNEDVVLDVWIEDDFVQQMELDFLQFADFEGADIPEGVDQAAVRLTFEEFDGEVEAPKDSTKVDTRELAGLFTGAAGGGAGAAGGDQPTDICEQLKGAPPEVIEQFAQECPELQSN
jgi:hypothetical protein